MAGLVAVAACLGLPAAASAGATGQTRAEVLSYWTDERIDAARPGDELLADTAPARGALDGVNLGLGAEPAARASAQQVRSPNKGGRRAHGKVLFTLGGLNYQCSATTVKSRTKKLVVTAGHCTYSTTSGYASNFMFIPAKDGNSEPYGRWTANRLKAMPQWEASEDIRYDVAFATMARRQGKKIQHVVGARGMAFNRQGNQDFRAFGYPAESPFNGQTPFKCKSTQEGSDNSQGQPAPNRIDCDMTGGSSGGGWVIAKGRVNSVVSYGYECTVIILPCENPEEGKLFGPYFGPQVKQLYRAEKQ